jgi:hypothetical protein
MVEARRIFALSLLGLTCSVDHFHGPPGAVTPRIGLPGNLMFPRPARIGVSTAESQFSSMFLAQWDYERVRLDIN